MLQLFAFNKLTTPFWTLNPSWYLVSGRLILTSTTGGQETAVSFTAVLVLQFWNIELGNWNSTSGLLALVLYVFQLCNGPSLLFWCNFWQIAIVLQNKIRSFVFVNTFVMLVSDVICDASNNKNFCDQKTFIGMV